MRRSPPLDFGSISVKPPLAFPRQRIGLLGGSFDPPHRGHLRTSRTALERLALDRVWWLVTPGNPLKYRPDLAPLARRLAQCRSFVRDPRITITGFEAALGSPYTFASLIFLRRRYPKVRFVWIMGADGLANLHNWRYWRDILHLVPVAVVDRPGWRHKAVRSRAATAFRFAYIPETQAARLAYATPPAWTILSGPLSFLSSTALRSRSPSVAQVPHLVAAGGV
jgi:nicotinate-nucleotide adenylyltransferase